MQRLQTAAVHLPAVQRDVLSAEEIQVLVSDLESCELLVLSTAVSAVAQRCEEE